MQTNQDNPGDQLRSDIDHATSDLNELIKNASLASVHDEFSELETNISNLPLRIQKIRDRKYAFDKILESQAAEFQKQWALKRNTIQYQITTEANNLENFLRPLEGRVAALNVGISSSITVKSIQGELDNYETKISTVKNSLQEMFDGIKQNHDLVSKQLTLIESTLDFCEAASFGFLPGECVVIAVKTLWTRDNREDKNDPEGYLFLTDQRLLFEQNQEIATKKVLFVTTEREKVQKLLFETPVASIESIKASKQGMFKNEDWLELQLASGSFARDVKLHLDGQDSVTWQKLINTVKSGDIDADRAIKVDQSAVEKARSAPEKCPNCGGAITKPVLRGMNTITCDFCGNVIRL
jgi:hypothetical protein